MSAAVDGICAHAFDSTVCVAAAGHDGAHVTSNERFPHGLQLPALPRLANETLRELLHEGLEEILNRYSRAELHTQSHKVARVLAEWLDARGVVIQPKVGA